MCRIAQVLPVQWRIEGRGVQGSPPPPPPVFKYPMKWNNLVSVAKLFHVHGIFKEKKDKISKANSHTVIHYELPFQKSSVRPCCECSSKIDQHFLLRISHCTKSVVLQQIWWHLICNLSRNCFTIYVLFDCSDYMSFFIISCSKIL